MTANLATIFTATHGEYVRFMDDAGTVYVMDWSLLITLRDRFSGELAGAPPLDPAMVDTETPVCRAATDRLVTDIVADGTAYRVWAGTRTELGLAPGELWSLLHVI